MMDRLQGNSQSGQKKNEENTIQQNRSNNKKLQLGKRQTNKKKKDF